MPYFNNGEVNILFLHIPKTGGLSVTKYFSNKYDIPLTVDSLYTTQAGGGRFWKRGSYQHQSYNVIKSFPRLFKVDFSDLNIMSVVRNPYDRLVSDLFWNGLISVDSLPEEVEVVVRQYFENMSDTLDNHKLPQYTFLTDYRGSIIPNVTLLRTESLTQMMHDLGYTDFDSHEHKSPSGRKPTMAYLNTNSLNMINRVYARDFVEFGYPVVN